MITIYYLMDTLRTHNYLYISFTPGDGASPADAIRRLGEVY